MTDHGRKFTVRELKMRARMITFRFLWRLILAAIALSAVSMLVSSVIALVDSAIFGDRFAYSVLGTGSTFSADILSLAAFFVLAPFTLGMTDYILSVSRGFPKSAVSVFTWAGDGKKIALSMKYALWQIIFTLVTFPLGKLSVYYIADRFAEWFEEASKLLNAIDYTGAESASVTSSLTELVTRSDVLIALGALIGYYLLMIPFLAIPYILVDYPAIKFTKALRLSVKVMLPHVPEFVLLVLSFTLTALISTVLFVVVIYLVVLFRVSTAMFVDAARADCSREVYLASNKGGDSSDDKELL